MVKFEINTAQNDEELDIIQTMTGYAFGTSPVLELDTSYRQYNRSTKRYLLTVEGKPCSTLAAIPMTQNVRGKVFPMQGVAGVATDPEYRKMGFVKHLMDHGFQEAREDGCVFSCLYPFKQSFYGRFGYINLPYSFEMKFNPTNLKLVLGIDTKGKIERLKISECLDRYYSFMTKYQKGKHGFSLFDRETHQRGEKSKLWVAFVVVDGKDRGMMSYSTTGFEKDMNIRSFLYFDSNAMYVLLKHLAVHRDQFLGVNMRLMTFERPETWVFDGRMTIKSRDWVPVPMARVLDVEKIGGMLVGEGEVVMKIRDKQCEWNSGIWHLKSENGILVVEKTNKESSCEVTIAGFSALIYGGYLISDLEMRGWITGDVSQLERLFPDVTPELFSTF